MSMEKDYLKMVESSSKSWANLPPLVRQVKDDSLAILLNCIEDLFSNCDDLFFDLSSRAASNAEQNLYFESMRELRFKKAAVINAFRQGFEQNFLALTRPANSLRGSETTAEPLTLVQNDALEQEVAVTGMISKARTNCQEPLYHLATRLDFLVPRITIDQDNNPLDPAQVCRAFAGACDLFEISIKAKIIIFKQFDRLVGSKLARVYSAANELLINAGVLPKISHSIQKHASAGEPERQSATDGEVSAPLQFEFAELSNLMASMRRLGLTAVPNYVSYCSNPGPVLSSNDLLGLLANQRWPQAEESEGGAFDLRHLVQAVLAASNPQAPSALQQPDEDVINLVAMFFDFVLDDRNLPVPIQALISRLQLPILKVAIKDRTFFSSTGHPARRLINIIADASIGWDEADQPKKDKLYNKIFEVVQAITEQFNEADPIKTFSEKLAELQEYVQQEQHRTALVERRTSQSAEGQARTHQAKSAVQELLFGRLEQTALPPSVSTFLVEQWQQLLVLTHLKHGEESPEWLEAVQVIDDLIWACLKHEDARSLQRLSKMKPELLQRVAAGLSKIAYTAETSQSTIRSIGEVLDLLQAQTNIEFRHLTAEQAISLGHTPGSGSKNWQEMTAMERQQARYRALTYEFIRKAESLPLGTWISYEDSRRGRILRCKLAARIEASDTYVFVNRFGFKAMEKTRKDFAYDMQQRRATVLQSGVLFDRAMENIVNNLRQVSRSAG